MEADDRRRSKRQSFIAFAWYHLITDEIVPEEELYGLAHSCDVSREGVGLIASRSLAADQKLFLKVVTSKGAFSAVGRVANCAPLEGGRYRIGVRFEILPPSDVPLLDRLAGA